MKALLDAAINATAPARRKVMGLLTDKAREVPQNARNLWGEMQNYPAELNALVSPQMNQQVQQAMTAPSQGFDKEKGMQMAMDYLQTTNPVGGLLAHTVYHGSPHKFNKFDMSKIGTGEGAQAYGHGLYFAEAPDVAKSYIPPNAQAQETIAGLLKKETARAQRYSNEGGMEVYEMFQKGYTPAGIRANIDNLIESGEAHPDYIKKMEQAYKKATEIYKANPAGQMYKVDIPDEAIPRMLDWDAKLSEQTPEVKKALSDIIESYRNSPLGDPQGLNVAKSIGEDELLRRGIPGIRYLDGNSRGTGGTSNFVLFDDQLPRILEINGQPTGLLSYADEAAQAAKKKGGLLGDPMQDFTKSIKANKNLKQEATARSGVVEVGPKFWQMTPDNKARILTHENTHLSGIEDVAMRDNSFWDAINQREMFGKIDPDSGAITNGVNGQYIPSENIVEAITAYKHDPEWLLKNYPVAYEYIENLFPNLGR